MQKIFSKIIFIFLINTFYVVAQQPNIVWIISEDNSPLLGCYGDPIASTPNIDKLASEGVLLNNAFVNAPVCAPSRSTLITGMYPITLGTQHMRSLVKVPEDVKFFPQYLKEHGYYTTLRMKRDYNIPTQNGTWDKDDFWHLDDALKNKDEEQPFFMLYNTWMTHESILHDENHLPNSFLSTFENDADVEEILKTFKEINPEDVVLPKYQPDTKEAREDLALYYKAIQMMDYEVGRIISFLKDKDLFENTIIIYSSDHGGVLGRSKRFDYESGLKIPMIIRFPEKYKNLNSLKTIDKTSNRLISFVDMAPTILSLVGIEKPSNMQGNAFLGTFESKPDTIAYGFRGRMDEAYDMIRTVRDKRFRYIRNYMPYVPNGQNIATLFMGKSISAWRDLYNKNQLNDAQKAFFEPKPIEELYDIVKDPDNINNLALDLNYSKQIEQFRTINKNLILENFDTGFFPEGELWTRSNDGDISSVEVIENNLEEWNAAVLAAEKATFKPTVKELEIMLKNEFSTVNYWGVVGCVILEDKASPLKNILIELLNNCSGDVTVVVAESLYLLGEKDMAIKSLMKAMESDNKFVRLRALNVVANRNISGNGLYEKIESIDKENEYINKISTYILKK